MVDFALSAFDLEQTEGFKDVFRTALKNFPEGFETVNDLGEEHILVRNSEILGYLYKNGMDTDQPVEIVVCNHTVLTQRGAVNYYRFEGEERLDSKWIKSGVATMDAIIASEKDSSMRFMLRSIKAEV